MEETVGHIMNCGGDSPVVAEDVTALCVLSEDSLLNIQNQVKLIMSYIEDVST